MQIRNNNDLDLTADDKERITVEAISRRAGDTAAFALNTGEEGPLPNPFTFTLNKARKDPCILTLQFVFVGGGGAFDVTVTGSNGGPQSFLTFHQFGLATGSISYNIDII